MLGDLAEIPQAPSSTSLRVLQDAREVNRLQTRIRALKMANPPGRTSLLNSVRNLLSIGGEIDSRLHRWRMTVDEEWKYKLLSADDVIFEKEHYAEKIHIYPSIEVARVWNAWRTTRINLQAAINDLLDWTQAVSAIDLKEERGNVQGISQIMVDEICNTVHYYLGNTRPQASNPGPNVPIQKRQDTYERHAKEWGWFHLLVSLRTCAKAPALLPHQRQWIHRSLVRISRLACQTNSQPAPTAPPVLMTDQLPSSAFSFPIITFNNHASSSPVSSSGEMEHTRVHTQPRLVPSTYSSSIVLPSQLSEAREADLSDTGYGSSRTLPPERLSSPEDRSLALATPQQIDLPFFNTTRPDQIKDPEIQKKIRRDVMLHHMRKQDPKQREERQRRARAGSAARAASRRRRETSTHGEKRAEEGERSGGGFQQRRVAGASDKGKERAEP